MDSAIYLALLLVLVSLLFFVNRKSPSKRLPPGSLGLPIIGQSLQLLRAMRANKGEEWLQERAQRYGPISRLNIFGHPTAFVRGRAANKFIYSVDETTLCCQQPASVRRLLEKRSLLELSGQDHRRVRGALLSFLKPKALKLSVAKMDQEIRVHLKKHWHHNQDILVYALYSNFQKLNICISPSQNKTSVFF